MRPRSDGTRGLMALDATQDSYLTPLHATCCRRRRHSEHKGWDVERLGASEVYSSVTASVSLAVTQHLTNPPQHPPCQKQQGAVMPENGLSEQHSQMARCPQQWRRNRSPGAPQERLCHPCHRSPTLAQRRDRCSRTLIRPLLQRHRHQRLSRPFSLAVFWEEPASERAMS